LAKINSRFGAAVYQDSFCRGSIHRLIRQGCPR
jgi:hypothetical protein